MDSGFFRGLSFFCMKCENDRCFSEYSWKKTPLTLFNLDRDECDHPYLYLILLTSKADYSIVLISSVVCVYVWMSLSLSLK